MQRQKIFLSGGIVVSILMILTAATITANRTSETGRASGRGEVVSVSKENSYVFASPISALSDGTSLIRVTVFLLNNEGLGVVGQVVKLQSSHTITITDIQPITDAFGRALFDVSSTNPGTYTIAADIAGVVLPQTVSIAFR